MAKKKKEPRMVTNCPEVLEQLAEIKANPNRPLSKLGQWMRSGKHTGAYILPEDMRYVMR